MMTNTHISDLAIHSGEFLKETLETIGMTQVELANKLGVSPQAINEIINCNESITLAIAFKLEDTLGIPSNIWIGLESEYQMALVNQENKNE